jgi:hypothetical protein
VNAAWAPAARTGRLRALDWAGLLAASLLLFGCASTPSPESDALSPSSARELMARALPPHVQDRNGWAADMYAAFASMEIKVDPENVCAVVAVTDQESNFQVDPVVPGLSKLAWREIDSRAQRMGLSRRVVRTLLRIPSSEGRSYAQRLDAARTEGELSQIFEDLIGVLPGGQKMLADRNPVRTGGPMQVSIAFAENYADEHPYPYPLEGKSFRREVFTRRGGLYFGIAHLLDYPADYDRPLFRFADFNAGHYASRNAAFQNALTAASGIPLDLDGDLVRLGAGANDAAGSTELAARTLGKRLKMSDREIRNDLERGQTEKFARSDLYEKVFELADSLEGRSLPRAVMPKILLKSPKITRQLTTEWFSLRVQQRHERCLERAVVPAAKSRAST